ncbi:MAG: sensor histidine kinase [Muribaculaceae bacterium]
MKANYYYLLRNVFICVCLALGFTLFGNNIGELDNASKSYESSMAISDSLQCIEIDRQLNELNEKYETALSQSNVMRLEAEKDVQQLWTVIFTGIIAVLVLAVFLWWKISRSRQKREAELRYLKGQIDAIDQERARLAAELYDGICSDLTDIFMLMQSENTGKEEIMRLLNELNIEVRDISHSLMPPRFEDVTLSMLIYALAAKSNGLIGVDCGIEPDIDKTDCFHIYRIIKSLLQNIRKHSAATIITVKIRPKSISIIDNGTKFNPMQAFGLGHDNIQRRLKAVDGMMKFSYDDGKNVATIMLK